MPRSADYYAPGDWNFFCDLCGSKEKASRGVKTWKNTYVCRHHKEERNPQDFLRGIKDSQNVPWSRPEPQEVDAYPTMCTVRGKNGVAGAAVAACATPSTNNGMAGNF